MALIKDVRGLNSSGSGESTGVGL